MPDNTIKRHGGARPGAGRPRREPVMLPPMPATDSPVVFLLAVMNSEGIDVRLRLDAAKTLYNRAPPVVGVKDAKQDAARKAGAGRFAASKAPKLVISNP